MASLYIKDPETAAIATRLAARLGVTKTEAVRKALQEAEAALQEDRTRGRWSDWITDHRRRHPLPLLTDDTADKAFFDALWDER